MIPQGLFAQGLPASTFPILGCLIMLLFLQVAPSRQFAYIVLTSSVFFTLASTVAFPYETVISVSAFLVLSCLIFLAPPIPKY